MPWCLRLSDASNSPDLLSELEGTPTGSPMPHCEITDKRARVGNNVSHANNRTKRLFKANIQRVKIEEADGTVRRAQISTRALKSNMVDKALPRRIRLQLLADEGKLPAGTAAKNKAKEGTAKKAAPTPKAAAPAAKKAAAAPKAAAATKKPAAKK